MPQVFTLEGEELLLIPERAIFFSRLKTLVISDLHLGKINHFRKAGIPVPTAANQTNTETLIRLLMDFKPARVIFIGDLFHSHYNAEWDVLGQVIRSFPSCSFELVPGNHDIMSHHQYNRHHIQVLDLQYPITPLITLVHEPVADRRDHSYFISGHVHPAVFLMGKGRQSLTLPCFWFSKNQAFLPAFGVFTGFRPMKPARGDQIFAIVEGEIVPLALPAIQNNAD